MPASPLLDQWLTVVRGFVHDFPKPTARPAQFGAFVTDELGNTDQTNGYHAFTALLFLDFRSDGTLIGDVSNNRGGQFFTTAVTGEHIGEFVPNTQSPAGRFHFSVGSGDQVTRNNFKFVMTGSDTAAYIFDSTERLDGSPFRTFIASGTLERVQTQNISAMVAQLG